MARLCPAGKRDRKAYNPHAPRCRRPCSCPLLPLAALAQAQAPITRDPVGEPRKNQKVERIHVEDGGNSIDEVRVGGQTQSVTVQPKANVPAYELQPNDLARSRPRGQPRRPGRAQAAGLEHLRLLTWQSSRKSRRTRRARCCAR
jgi:hypothetical protein